MELRIQRRKTSGKRCHGDVRETFSAVGNSSNDSLIISPNAQVMLGVKLAKVM